jgi:hypothetical protein
MLPQRTSNGVAAFNREDMMTHHMMYDNDSDTDCAAKSEQGEAYKPPYTLSVCVAMPSDRTSISGHLYTLLQQVVPVRLTEDMIARGKSKSRKNLPIGHPGLMCRHCMGGAELKNSKTKLVSPANAFVAGPKEKLAGDGSQRGALKVRKPKRMHLGDGTGTYFATCVDELEKRCHAIYKHVIGCPLCPADIRKQMEFYEAVHKAEMTQLPRGAQKTFLRLVWNRLHSRSKEETPEAAVPNDGKTTTASDDMAAAHQESRTSAYKRTYGASHPILTPTESELSRQSLNSSNNSVQSRESPHGLALPFVREQLMLASPQASVYAAAMEQQRLALEMAKARQQAQAQAALQREMQVQAQQQAQADALTRATKEHVYQQLLQRQALINAMSLNQRTANPLNFGAVDAMASFAGFAGQQNQVMSTNAFQLQQTHAMAQQQAHAALISQHDRGADMQRYQPALFDRQRSKRQNRNHSAERRTRDYELTERYAHEPELLQGRRQNRNHSPERRIRDYESTDMYAQESEMPQGRSEDEADASKTLASMFNTHTDKSDHRDTARGVRPSPPDNRFVRVSCGWSCDQCSFVPLHLRAPGSVVCDKNPPSLEIIEEHMSLCKGGRIDLTEIIDTVGKMCDSIPGFAVNVLNHPSFKGIVSSLVGHNEDLVTVFTDGVRAERLGVISDGGGRNGLWTGFPGRVDTDEALSAIAAFAVSEPSIDPGFVEDRNFCNFVKLLTPGCGYEPPLEADIAVFM